MNIPFLKTMSIPKLAVLATGLTAAMLAATLSPQAAQAYPTKATDCAGCHTGVSSTPTTATPSTGSPAAGAGYTVAITLVANPAGGNSGYAIVPTAPDTMKANGGDAASLTSYTANMTAPAAAGTYAYTVYTNMGSTDAGQTSSATYSITVAGGATPTDTTTPTGTATTPTGTVTTPTGNATTPGTPTTTASASTPPVGASPSTPVVAGTQAAADPSAVIPVGAPDTGAGGASAAE